MAKCKICGARLEDDVTVCPVCGAKVGEAGTGATVVASADMQKAVCPSCGAEVVGEHRFCPQCGTNLRESNSVSASRLQTTTTAAPSASSPAPATAANRKVGITLMPTSLSQPPEYFDNVQDLDNSTLMTIGGEWSIEVEGELTEDEMKFICDKVIVPGRVVKRLDLSKCITAYLLKDTQGSEESLLNRCSALETIKLPNRTIERNGYQSSSSVSSSYTSNTSYTGSSNSYNTKSEEEQMIEAFVNGNSGSYGENSACQHYKKAFQKFREGGSVSSNKGGYFFGPFYLFYRRSVLAGTLGLLGDILCMWLCFRLFGNELGGKVAAGVGQLVFGLFGDKMIYSNFTKLYEHARFLYPSSEDERISFMERNGGSKVSYVFMALGALVVGYILWVAMIMHLMGAF